MTMRKKVPNKSNFFQNHKQLWESGIKNLPTISEKNYDNGNLF